MDSLNQKELIKSYCEYKKKKLYEEILNEYKIRYIYSESKVEGNVTPEEQLGIAIVYDYIQKFNFDEDYFNIFTTSLVIHQKLFSECAGGDGFGGHLRDTTVVLKDSNIEVMSAEDARKYFNQYIATSDEIFLPLENNDILQYIEKCIYVTTELIKVQPFMDGNKRTFRSLLNLLFKKITIPPIYIKVPERKLYKEFLMKAMEFGDYIDLYNFYYDKIEESINELDFENSIYLRNKNKTKRLIDDIYKIQ